MGVGGLVAYEVAKAVAHEPQAMVALLSSWGPLFAVVVSVLVFGDRRFGQMIENQKSAAVDMVAAAREGAKAQQQMADAVAQLAQRDDRHQQEVEVTLGYVGTKLREVLQELQEVKAAVNSKAQGASA